MSPENAMEGNFSEKSDVYNFELFLLEIISGQKMNWIIKKKLFNNLKSDLNCPYNNYACLQFDSFI